ncbi:MAG: hypothetical protein EPN82_11245 [Bacteroidetes bacterium]|nr:MAG: hypothetical protein EPN82_11245 [Bacteroidota bacterium]
MKYLYSVKIFKMLVFNTFIFLLFIATSFEIQSKGIIIPTDATQQDFVRAYKMVLAQSGSDYRFTNATIDTSLFPDYGEYSICWVKTGVDRGSFVYPDALPSAYSGITYNDYDNYNWQGAEHYSIQFKPYQYRIALFNSNIQRNNKTVTWQYLYFKNLFDSYISNGFYYLIDERYLDTNSINGATQLLIIPSFNAEGSNQKFYIDSVFATCPQIKAKLDAFLANGGTIYAEGNAVYFIEKLGYLAPGSVNFDNFILPDPATGMQKIVYGNSNNPITFTQNVTDEIYTTTLPTVNAGNAEVIANVPGFSPVVFILNGPNANGGRIICNTGLPTTGGMNELKSGSRQLQWTLNSFLYAITNNIDVTRSVYNDLPSGITAGKNAVSFDALDTFEVRIKVRNLSSSDITNITINEYLRNENINNTNRTYFQFVDVISQDVTATITGNNLNISGLSMPPLSEKVITYRLRTPDVSDKIHESVDRFLSWSSYIYSSYNVTQYTDNEGKRIFWKWNDYAYLMFSARLVADADLNWKNFLGLYYQPFKVFMIMENKERTDAIQTKYVQYIPKDVPFYWVDHGMDIPILKTPGGKFVTVLKGSNDENNPEFDMDADGHPDAWLDTASIYPKGYTLTEADVYWLNPWEHLRSGDSTYYEDIDHDGKRAMDTNGDGIVDIEETGDKIRVWKVTWDIGTVRGYQYFDPYCYYEIWVDPPDLVNMSAGVSKAYNRLDTDVNGMFYPYSRDINNPNLSDTSWTHWMDRDDNGNIVWKQLIYQKINNYEGYTFIDTAKQNYHLLPTDFCAGTVPQPHNEFIAALSLGGEEIDMTHPTPNNSLYSKLEFKTIFNESRTTPIRTTYTYYAPLPNPLQFEYLSNNFLITDPNTNQQMTYLPKYGKANLTFDLDASTEYTYYWIRNAGHDVDYNDPSEKIEGNEKLGDGVFGYMIYDLPKGMGGYSLTLPKLTDGTYDINNIVSVDGKPFEKWLDNKNTKNAIEIWEDPFQYHIYIPQLLIPPALDDDNFDGIDDWIDDRGDRFSSKTGFLHDNFMLDNGEQWLNYPETPFRDDIYGMVDSGWYHGADNTYGDDFFENLGKTHIQLHAIYEGKGKEGPVDISKGGWLVVEEIFGGSPWVIFSHVLSGFAKGSDLRMSSSTTPSVVKYGTDTTYIKHYIEDRDEPHQFNSDFDPFHIAFGYGESTITTMAGGKDPCSLISPPIDISSIIDPQFNHRTITLVPLADKNNPDLKDYPKTVTGTFLEVKIEVMNGTDDNWFNTTINPTLGNGLGNTNLVMSYVAYPRPLVPAQVDPVTGKVTRAGDDLGTFRAGWRFNQPEGEVLIKMGNALPLLQPSRRAYFVMLFSIDETLINGIYNIDFTINGERKHYTGANDQQITYAVPSVQFSITDRSANGNILEYQKVVIGKSHLTDMKVNTTDNFFPTGNVKWSNQDVNYLNFDTLSNSLSASFNPNNSEATIDLSAFSNYPDINNARMYILEQGIVTSENEKDLVKVTEGNELNYLTETITPLNLTAKELYVRTSGPKVKDYKKIVSLNGMPIQENQPFIWDNYDDKDVEVLVEAFNSGSNIAENTKLDIFPGLSFVPKAGKLDPNCTISGNTIIANLGSMIPGESRKLRLHFGASPDACLTFFDESSVIPKININYKGNTITSGSAKYNFSIDDLKSLDCPTYDFVVENIDADISNLTFGSISQAQIKYRNGLVPSKNLSLNLYAVKDWKDTILVGQKTISSLNALESGKITMDFNVPYKTNFLELYAKIDGNDNVIEFCENNNIKSTMVPINGPKWIQDVQSYPNPFKNKIDLSYTLARDERNISITFFTVNGKEVGRIDNCPAISGTHSVSTMELSSLPTGTYVYKIAGINADGETELYVGIIEKY